MPDSSNTPAPYRPGHIPIFNNAGRSARNYDALMGNLARHMREAIRAQRPERYMAQLRAELARLLADAASRHIEPDSFRRFVFATLDPVSIKAHLGSEPLRLPTDLWNEIAPQITPEVIDAYFSVCGQAKALNFLEDGQAPLPEAAARRFVEALEVAPPSLQIRLLEAAEHGRTPASFALYALQNWLSKGPLPGFVTSRRELCRAATITRLIALRQGWKGDDWSPGDFADLQQIMTLTRSAHGRLNLMTLMPDLEELLRAPDATLARVASAVQTSLPD